MRCSKCDEKKPEDQFEKYWHSTHQNFYRRRVCRDCISIQKKAYKAKVKEEKRVKSILDAGGKSCSKCNELKLPDEYYTNRTICKVCVREAERIKDEQEREQKRLEQIELGLSTKRVPNKPGDYADELQKQSTYEILTMMGWSYNEEKNLFYKLPLKDDTGRWLVLKGQDDSLIKKRNRVKIKENMTVETLPIISITKHRRKTTPPDEIINKICYDYFIGKETVIQLAKKYNLPDHHIHNTIVLVYQKFEDAV